MLAISAQKVAFVIIRARAVDVKVARWDRPSDTADSDTILEDRASDGTESELRTFISSLNNDEQAELVAIAWIGRETFEPEEFTEAFRTAKEEATTPTEDYLLGMPLLADYLEDGLAKLGVDPTQEEDEIYQH